MSEARPGVLIAGTASGVGKTTIATGIMGALRRRGLAVQPFKVGPDYIDPSYHTTASGRVSRNLDSWMVPAPALKELYVRAAAEADVTVVEGVMGMFDGRAAESGAGSSAEVARILGLPVLLVVDAAGTARSTAAMALGYARFDRRVKVAGVIANNVGSASHGAMIRSAVEGEIGLPVVGCFPRRPELHLPERHLGLVPVAEGRIGATFFDEAIAQAEQNVNLDLVLDLARQARPLDLHPTGLFPRESRDQEVAIGVASDEAFCFYYADNLDLLGAWGARLVAFSPLRDPALPQGIGGLYLGGGFPELFAPQLAANQSLKSAIRRAWEAGMPIYAECGGLMYLCETMAGVDGESYAMVGIVPSRAVLRARRVTLGYTELSARRDTILLDRGQNARGHEFHWSSLETGWDPARVPYWIADDERGEGYQDGRLLASYVHLHFASNRSIAANFVRNCMRWRQAR